MFATSRCGRDVGAMLAANACASAGLQSFGVIPAPAGVSVPDIANVTGSPAFAGDRTDVSSIRAKPALVSSSSAHPSRRARDLRSAGGGSAGRQILAIAVRAMHKFEYLALVPSALPVLRAAARTATRPTRGLVLSLAFQGPELRNRGWVLNLSATAAGADNPTPAGWGQKARLY
jgi:hypothetical protein